jgi:hypothetical protein
VLGASQATRVESVATLGATRDPRSACCRPLRQVPNGQRKPSTQSDRSGLAEHEQSLLLTARLVQGKSLLILPPSVGLLVYSAAGGPQPGPTFGRTDLVAADAAHDADKAAVRQLSRVACGARVLPEAVGLPGYSGADRIAAERDFASQQRH